MCFCERFIAQEIPWYLDPRVPLEFRDMNWDCDEAIELMALMDFKASDFAPKRLHEARILLTLPHHHTHLPGPGAIGRGRIGWTSARLHSC